MPKSSRSQSLPQAGQAQSTKNEGFFAKLKRRFRIGSKGSYSVGGLEESLGSLGQYIPRSSSMWREGELAVEDPLRDNYSDSGHQIASVVSHGDNGPSTTPTLVCQRADLTRYAKHGKAGKSSKMKMKMKNTSGYSSQDMLKINKQMTRSVNTATKDSAANQLQASSSLETVSENIISDDSTNTVICATPNKPGLVEDTFTGDIVQNDFVLPEESAIDLDDEVFARASSVVGSPPAVDHDIPVPDPSIRCQAELELIMEEPGYETLESIRQQIQDKTGGNRNSARVETREIVTATCINVSCDSDEIKEQTSKTSLDSGLGSPGQGTQSPNLESERSSAGSVASDRGTCSVSEVTDKVLDTRMVSSFHTIHPGPACQMRDQDAPAEGDQQWEEEEIYSNFQIALRKQSVRKSQSEPTDVGVCDVSDEEVKEIYPPSDITSPNGDADHGNTHLLDDQETSQSCGEPPPLPDRRYSCQVSDEEVKEIYPPSDITSPNGDSDHGNTHLLDDQETSQSCGEPPPLPDRRYSCHVSDEEVKEIYPPSDIMSPSGDSDHGNTPLLDDQETSQSCGELPPLPDRRYSCQTDSTCITESIPTDGDEARTSDHGGDPAAVTAMMISDLPSRSSPPLIPDRKYSTTDLQSSQLWDLESSATPVTIDTVAIQSDSNLSADTQGLHEYRSEQGSVGLNGNEVSNLNRIHSSAFREVEIDRTCVSETGLTSSEEVNTHGEQPLVGHSDNAVTLRGNTTSDYNVNLTRSTPLTKQADSVLRNVHVAVTKVRHIEARSEVCPGTSGNGAGLNGVSSEVGKLHVSLSSPKGNRRLADKTMVDVIRGSIILRDNNMEKTSDLSDQVSELQNISPVVDPASHSEGDISKLASGLTVSGCDRSDSAGESMCTTDPGYHGNLVTGPRTRSSPNMGDSHVVCADEHGIRGHDSVGLSEPAVTDQIESMDLYHDDEPIHMTLEEVLGPNHLANMAPAKVKRSSKHSAECDGVRAFKESMQQLKECGWYWGPLNSDEAEIKLSNKPDGSFLVRDSANENYILSLTFRSQGRIHHTRIEHFKGKFGFWSQPESHGKATIKEFIEQAMENSRSGHFKYFLRAQGPGLPPIAMYLLYPVSRFKSMRSLMHMCRFTILQLVRRDHVDFLPIPLRIKKYLQEHQYYAEIIDDEADDVIGFEGNNNIVRR